MRFHPWCVSLLVCAGFAACGGKAPSSAAGTYELDRAAFTAALVDEILGGMSEAERADAAAMATAKLGAAAQAEAMQLTSVLHEDGTWTTSGNMAGNEFQSKGTWTLEGTKLQLTTTEQDGKKEAKLETHTATLEGGVLTIQPDGAPFQFKLKRK